VPEENTAAFTDQTNHTIYFTPHYFNPNLAKNDHYGSIIHEVSHMNDVASTQDYAYGGLGSHNLGKTDPNHAVQNADGYKRFWGDRQSVP
jgi:hypothetical protein